MECMYCGENPKCLELMVYICDLEATKLYLFKNQAMPGRCVIAAKDHVNEFFDLTEAQTEAYARDMRRVCKAIKKVFSPDKINLGMYNDKGNHLHCHIVPKYEGGVNWGTTFEMQPSPAVTLTDEEYAARADQIRKALDQE